MAQGQGGLAHTQPQKYNNGTSHEWIEQDQLFEICQNLGVQDWRDVYTKVDVQNLFENFVVELNHGEISYLTSTKTVEVKPISSGVHIGSSNWIMNIEGE